MPPTLDSQAALAVIVQIETSTVVEVHWADGKGATVTAPAGDGPRMVELRRYFATLDEARGFEGTFVVTRDAAEVAREAVRFDSCDRVHTYGIDPAGIGVVVFGRTLADRLERDTHRNNRGPLGCYGSLSSIGINGDAAIHRAIYNFPLAAGKASFLLGDNEIPPASLQLWDDHVVYVLHADFPSSLPLDADLAILRLALAGVPAGSVTVSFIKCSSADTSTFAQEEQWLLPSDNTDGGAAIDINAGYQCTNRDGSGFGAIP